MKLIEGGITAAKGFKASGVEAGIKYKGRADLALVFSEKPCVVAGTFTSNAVKAAPVLWDMDIVRNSDYVQALVVNSGIANACTSKQGLDACEKTAEKAAELLNIKKESVLVGSTGVIGWQLPLEKLLAGIEKAAPLLSDSVKAGHDAERAIMTTDTLPKEVAVTVDINGTPVTVGGMSKGSGMIHPNMCTMLAYVSTDANITKEMLTEIVKNDVKDTFNMISVDGDTSTNDTYLVMANGMAGNELIDKENDSYFKLKEAIHYISETLAKKMAADGEGASALFTAHVFNADTKQNARVLARSVISSSLSKAAIYGHDSNFGRFLCALGYSGVKFDPDTVSLSYRSEAGELKVFENGLMLDYPEDEAGRILSCKEVTVDIDMHMGSEEACAWGCDLTEEYVRINSDYRS